MKFDLFGGISLPTSPTIIIPKLAIEPRRDDINYSRPSVADLIRFIGVPIELHDEAREIHEIAFRGRGELDARKAVCRFWFALRNTESAPYSRCFRLCLFAYGGRLGGSVTAPVWSEIFAASWLTGYLHWRHLRDGDGRVRSEAAVPESVLSNMWRLALPEHVMSPAEYRKFQRLPARIKVFRGYGDSCSAADAARGWSWTRRRDVAYVFSNNGVGKPMLLSGTVDQADVLAVFTCLDQDELVVRPGAVRNVKVAPAPPGRVVVSDGNLILIPEAA